MSIYSIHTLERIKTSLAGFEARRKAMLADILKKYEPPTGQDRETIILRRDIYASKAAVNLYTGANTAAALEQVRRTALWFDLPHPNGRDPRGESTFAAIGLLPSLYYCADKITSEVRAAVDRFFLTKNFESMYESENHRLQHHAALYLAGQFYADRRFEWCGLTGREIVEREEAWLKEFIHFRAKESWGEFDSCGYLAVDFGVLLLLYDLSRDDELRRLSGMMMDVLLLDMAVDSRGALYGGAHGRIYPPSALNAASGGMQSLYYYYFGHEYPEYVGELNTAALLSGYRPSPIVYEVALGRVGTYENREAKHLHCIPEGHEVGRINKYTYLTDKYIVGAVNRQDDYSREAQLWYAHHEQHELDALILADPRAKIFTHHPGHAKEHNRWTGDLGCRCVSTFAWRNVAMAIYDIKKPEEYPYINAHFNRHVMKDVRMAGKWVFGALDGVYAALYGSNGWSWACDALRSKQERCHEEHALDDDEIELWSDGRQHACVIELSDADESYEAFIGRVSSNVVSFDVEHHRLDYTSNGHTLTMDGIERLIDGKSEVFPYKLFDSPYIQSEWDSERIYVTGFSGQKVYDFATVTVE